MEQSCTLGELLIDQLALTIEDNTLVFHGFGSPLVQIALHVAKRVYAPNLVLVAGATYGVNPNPPFIAPTTNDWVHDRDAECHLSIGELFDLSASGRLGRMFLSGIQIDRWGNTNVTKVGRASLKIKLPGGGGACNLSCNTKFLTLWTAAHRSDHAHKGKRRYRIVSECDYVTGFGHKNTDGVTRKQLGYRGNGPQWLITDLGVFDFDRSGHLRLDSLYPHTSVEEVIDNTEFKPKIKNNIKTVSLPSSEVLSIIRKLDPLRVHEKELLSRDRSVMLGESNYAEIS
ncbi:MAG: glutaconate CoA-transferase subunit B [Enterobacterales bacterium]|jgi:glutaconate CoA-transferase subunit B